MHRAQRVRGVKRSHIASAAISRDKHPMAEEIKNPDGSILRKRTAPPARAHEPLPQGMAARLCALNVLETVLNGRKTPDDAFATARYADLLEPRDRSFARALVLATLRRKPAIDAAIRKFVAKEPPDDILRILMLVATERGLLNVPAHASVTTAVDITKRNVHTRHFQGLVNAVARKLSDEAENLLAEKWSAQAPPPYALAAHWKKTYGADIMAALIDAHGLEPPIDLVFRKDATAEAQRLIKSHGAFMLPTGALRLAATDVTALPGYASGAFFVQDAAASLPARLFGNVRGKRIADLCAAPGGKTMELADAGALVTAVEKDPARMAQLKENLARTHLAATCITGDALSFRPQELFEGVLLDAPCTATGTIRRHPEIVFQKDQRSIEKAAEMQAALLDAAARLVAPGGMLVYAVCSLEPEEGEHQINIFLARNRHFTRKPLAKGEEGIEQAFITKAGDLRTLPCHWPQWGGLDGFYACRLVRGA